MSPASTHRGGADLLYHAALLAGLGAQARGAAAAAATGAGAPGARSCVDAGEGLLLALDAPGGRALHTLRRLDGGAPAQSRWRGERLAPGGIETYTVDTFPGDGRAGWATAQRAAGPGERAERLRRAHAALGVRASVFGVERAAGGALWATWQLDRHADLARALAACGLPAAWPAVADALGRLLGRAPSRTGGPWSVSLPMHADGPARVGTSLWARLPEGPEKRRALAALADDLGGDGRFAEALYRLLQEGGAGAAARRVGRAVELSLDGGRLAAARWILAVPAEPEPPLPISSEQRSEP